MSNDHYNFKLNHAYDITIMGIKYTTLFGSKQLIGLTETIKDARSSQPIRVQSENSSKTKEVQGNYDG